MAVEQRRNSVARKVMEPSTNSLKKEGWKLKTSRKIKHFLWQCLSGYIASASKLKERHCGTDSTCQRCGAENETVNHVLFECPLAVQGWALSDIPSSPGIFLCSSLFVNVEMLLKYSKSPGHLGAVSSVFPWIMWYQWKARNNKCFNNKDTSPIEILQLASQEAEAWKMAQITDSTFSAEENAQPIALPTEAPTATSYWRCQVDASWAENSDGTGMGFVVLEQETEVLRGQCKGPQAESPIHAEADSLCWAMKEVNKRGLVQVHFESDCQQLVHIIQQKKQWPALAPVLDDIEAMIPTFNVVAFTFISRSANVRADGLAKDARSRVQSFSSFEVKDLLRLAIEASLYETL